jgi:hypothetical protein
MTWERSRTNAWQDLFSQNYFCVNRLNADWLVFPPLAERYDLSPWLCSRNSLRARFKGDSMKRVCPVCSLFWNFGVWTSLLTVHGTSVCCSPLQLGDASIVFACLCKCSRCCCCYSVEQCPPCGTGTRSVGRPIVWSISWAIWIHLMLTVSLRYILTLSCLHVGIHVGLLPKG